MTIVTTDDSGLTPDAGDLTATTPGTNDGTAGGDAPATTVSESSESTASGPAAPKSLLEAISTGVDEASKRRTIQPKAEEIAQGDTRPRNADGSFRTETAEEKAAREETEEAARLAKETPEEKAARLAAETPEQKAAREAKEAAAKKVDHVNDEIPKDLNKRTAERMRYLVDTVKAQEALVEQHNQLFTMVQEAGTPDEFASMINYMKGAKSNDPKVLEQAYTMLQSELRGLAVRMGKPLYEVNLLRDPANADLVAEIQASTLTNQRAHEIALQRETQKHQRTVEKTQTDKQTSADQTKAALDAGTAELNQVDRELRTRDGDAVFQAKYDVLVPMLKPLFARMDPKEWRPVFTEHYNNFTPPASAAPAVVVPKDKPQPLRTKTPAGGTTPNTAPKSALEAISQALDGI